MSITGLLNLPIGRLHTLWREVLLLWFLPMSLPSLFLTRLELGGISEMSFQAYLPICFLDLSLSLNLLLFYVYFKFSSFCLCHTSLQSRSLFFVSQQESLPSSKTAYTPSVEFGRHLFSPLFRPLVGVSQEKHVGPLRKQL